MPDLTELLRLAEDAGNRLPGEEWFDEYELRSVLMAHEQDARLIAAMSPDTAKKLIAVALAAEEVSHSLGDDRGEYSEEEVALLAALEELK